ncbi:hypothetical protein AOLI_G00294840 [Acnodon oligacanthus]
MTVAAYRQQAARDLRVLADLAENASMDYLLFHVVTVCSIFTASAGIEVDPVVFRTLEEMVKKLQSRLQSFWQLKNVSEHWSWRGTWRKPL